MRSKYLKPIIIILSLIASLILLSGTLSSVARGKDLNSFLDLEGGREETANQQYGNFVTLMSQTGESYTPGHVVRSGKYAIIAGEFNGMYIIDVFDPTDPQFISNYETSEPIVGVAVDGKYAYIANGYSGLRIIDISDPSIPSEVGFYDTPNYSHNVALDAIYAYVADGFAGLRIIDVSDPTAPSETGSIDPCGGPTMDVSLEKNFAYLACYNDGMYIIDVTNPAAPTLVSFYDTPSQARSVTKYGKYAYIADYAGGLRIIDVYDPTTPVEIGFYITPDLAVHVVVSGNYAYVADRNSGLRIIDISDPYTPIEVGFYETKGDVVGVALDESYIYVADYEQGLFILRFNAPVTTFLPINSKCNPLYFDDFSNPDSGWIIGEDEYALFEYLYGEYRILVKKPNLATGTRSGFLANDYILSVDVRNPSGKVGFYGVMFVVAGDWSQFYTFEIEPGGNYAIFRYNENSGWLLLEEGYSGAINPGTAPNELRVVRSYPHIVAYANGQQLASIVDEAYAGERHMGLIVTSGDETDLDVRFDNFAVYPITCGGHVAGSTNFSATNNGNSSDVISPRPFFILPTIQE